MKKLLLLGGSSHQVAAIEYANNQGYYTILCDYLRDNPGRNYANKFYCVSTTDRNAVLKVATEENIDGIVAYASDPAAPIAAYVGRCLGVPANPYESVDILANKALFREFLKINGFNTPRAASYVNYNEVLSDINNFKMPLMIKPVDSSGSKGVSKVQNLAQLSEAFEYAMINSREGRIIVEEFIEMAHEFMVGGDIFVHNGRLAFSGFLNCHRNENVSLYVPIGKSFPSFMSKEQMNYVENELTRVFETLKIKGGAFNIELMFDKNDNLYIIEIGPRNGGNMIPDLLEDATGVNLIEATIETAIGNESIKLESTSEDKFLATYNLHSNKTGILDSIEVSEEVSSKIYKKVNYKKPGDFIEYFDAANKALGIIFLEFKNLEEMKMILGKINQLVKVKVK